MSNSHDPDDVPTDSSPGPIPLSRREVMQASLSAATVFGFTQAAAAQQLPADGTIRLDAVTGSPLSSYVSGDGTIDVGGLTDAIADWQSGDLDTRHLVDAINYWHNGRVLDAPAGSEDPAWVGRAPAEIEGETNPTLSLTVGDQYTVEWTNEAGSPNNFVIVDDDGTELLATEEISQQGATQTVEFTAAEEMAEYFSASNATTQRGLLEVAPAVESPASPAPLTYQYFEGLGTTFPDFAGATPVEAGVTPDSEITLDLRQQDTDYGFVFERDLQVGELLSPGEYSFTVVASPAVRLLVDGDPLVDSPASGADTSASVTLAAGTHTLRVEYADPTGGGSLALGWTGPFGQVLPRIAAEDPLRTGQGFDWEVEVGPRPAFKQMIMPDSSTRSLAVGLYPNTGYCFDTTTATVRYGWMGGFLDYGPLVNYGNGRRENGASGNPLGPRFETAGVDAPLRIGSATVEPDVEFLGAEQSPRPPTLRYRVDDTTVNHTVTPIGEQVGLSHTIELEDPPSQMIHYRTDPDADVERTATTGEWNDGVLTVRGGESELSFSIASTGGEL
jgi:hypothetical protein